jgi:uncharacterized membrane protein YfhO
LGFNSVSGQVVYKKVVINNVSELFEGDNLMLVTNRLKQINLGDSSWANAQTNAQTLIDNTMQQPTNEAAQQTLDNMKVLQVTYKAADSVLNNPNSTPEQKQTAQQTKDSTKTAYTQAQQQLTEAVTTNNQLLNYRFPDSAWFNAINSYLDKYSGINADKSLAQYYWHKQTDSAYQTVIATYNLPDSLQQSLDAAYQAAQSAWSGLENGVAMLKFRRSAGGAASVWKGIDENNIKTMRLLVDKLRKSKKLDAIIVYGNLPEKFLTPDKAGYTFLTPSGDARISFGEYTAASGSSPAPP